MSPGPHNSGRIDRRVVLWWLLAGALITLLVFTARVVYRWTPSAIVDSMVVAVCNRDGDAVHRLADRLLLWGDIGLSAAVERLPRSYGKELACLLVYFEKVGSSAGPALLRAYRSARRDRHKANVLWALEVATEDPEVIPKYHQLLFTEMGWVIAGMRLRSIRGATGPYFDALRNDRVETGPRADEDVRKRMQNAFDEWWRNNRHRLRWTGRYFQVGEAKNKGARAEPPIRAD